MDTGPHLKSGASARTTADRVSSGVGGGGGGGAVAYDAQRIASWLSLTVLCKLVGTLKVLASSTCSN